MNPESNMPDPAPTPATAPRPLNEQYLGRTKHNGIESMVALLKEHGAR